jgi:hypothetical protein
LGAVVLSPYITPGTKPKNSYNHYSLLRTIEDLFHFTGGDDGAGHLGEAATWSKTGTGGNGSLYTISSFGDDVFTNPDYTPPPLALALGSSLSPPPPRLTTAARANEGDSQPAGGGYSTPAATAAAAASQSPAASPSAGGGAPLASKWTPHFLSTTPSGTGLGLYALVLLPLLALGVGAGLVSRRRSGGT